MYCRLLLKLILRDRAVWISTLVLAAAFSVPIAFNSPIYGPFFMKQGMQGFVDAFNTRAPQAGGTDLSPEQQNDVELARYANAALAAQTDAAFLDSAESYYALMGEGFQSGSIVGDRETNDAALAYCRALSSSGTRISRPPQTTCHSSPSCPTPLPRRRPSFPSSPSFSRRYSCSAPQGPGPWRQRRPCPNSGALSKPCFR